MLRSNLLEFYREKYRQKRQPPLGLTGHEVFDIVGIDNDLQPGQELTVRATAEDGAVTTFTVICRVDTPVEVNYYHNGGILHTVLRDIVREA